MPPKITTSKVSIFFVAIGALCLITGGLCLLALTMPGAKANAALFPYAAVAALVTGLLYIGFGEICDNIAIAANNSRVTAEQLVELVRLAQVSLDSKK